MDRTIPGIHHVTAIAGDPQANLDFYTGFLGLRLVKQTVNFDEPDVYHLYYGDESGRPGSLLTFFPFTFAAPGRVGAGMASTTAFAVPEAAVDFWVGRFADDGRDFDGPTTRFGEQVPAFTDPDGLRLELVAEAGLSDAPPGWTGGAAPGERVKVTGLNQGPPYAFVVSPASGRCRSLRSDRDTAPHAPAAST